MGEEELFPLPPESPLANKMPNLFEIVANAMARVYRLAYERNCLGSQEESIRDALRKLNILGENISELWTDFRNANRVPIDFSGYANRRLDFICMNCVMALTRLPFLTPEELNEINQSLIKVAAALTLFTEAQSRNA